MLDARRLRVLHEVGRQGSFSAAADALGYTQPAISRQIALLEQETGTTLLERHPGGARLTDAGELLARHAQGILARLQDAEDELGELLGLQSGRLRMATITSAAATIMPLAIGDFRKRLPGVELSVSLAEPGGTLAMLRAGEIDLALTNDETLFDQPDVDAVHLFDEPMLIALPTDHRLARRSPLKLSDLAAERWMLGTTTACPDAGRFINACRGAGFEPQIAFHNDDYTAILGFVAAGVGVAPVPEMVLRKAPKGVVALPLADHGMTRPIVASFPSGYRSGPAKAMLEILAQVSQRWVSRRPPELLVA
jgi:molybdate transport repressor ModE-like protein